MRNAIEVDVDYRETLSDLSYQLSFTYPLHLRNMTEETLDVHLEILPETLDRFNASLKKDHAVLAPGERSTVHATLSLPSAESGLPPGYTERAQVRVTTPEIPGYDAENEKLIRRTHRIAWGRADSFFSYQSISQNIPVVDEGNITRLRLQQEALYDEDNAAGIIISDHPERPAYPDTRLIRSLVLFEGCLLVIDRLRSDAGERQFDFPGTDIGRRRNLHIR